MKAGKFFFGLFLVLALSQEAIGESQKGAMIYGAGSYSCGKWLSDAEKKGSFFYHNAQWVFGFLSAMNKTDAAVGDKPAKDIDADGRIAFISKYCEEHPLNSISDAAVVLYAELKGWRD